MTPDQAETKHVPSALMRQTLLDRDLVRPVTTAHPVVRLLPWLKVVKIGGRSVMDRGRGAIRPLVDELGGALADHRLLITTGSGIRARHVMTVGLDFGFPTGVLAALASTEAEQNGHIVAALLAERGVAYVDHATAARQLPVALSASPGVVTNGYPPYELYDFPPAVGRIPVHRSDVGAFLLADAYGAERLVYAEDVDGIFTADPAGNDGAELIPRTGARELAARDLQTLPIDRMVLDLLLTAKHVREIQIVNGLTRGNLTRALEGEHVGTIVYAD